MLKFVALVYGPVARNNAQYRQTLIQAQNKARQRAMQLQAAASFVKLQNFDGNVNYLFVKLSIFDGNVNYSFVKLSMFDGNVNYLFVK